MPVACEPPSDSNNELPCCMLLDWKELLANVPKPPFGLPKVAAPPNDGVCPNAGAVVWKLVCCVGEPKPPWACAPPPPNPLVFFMPPELVLPKLLLTDWTPPKADGEPNALPFAGCAKLLPPPPNTDPPDTACALFPPPNGPPPKIDPPLPNAGSCFGVENIELPLPPKTLCGDWGCCCYKVNRAR